MKNNKKVIFVTGGGTGGHIYPAVAVFREILKHENFKPIYIGNKNRMEYNICKNENFDFLSIEAEGMPRKISLGFIVWGIKTFFAILKALFYFAKYKPSLVFGTGGYVSAPSLFAAKFLKIPYILHDCDAYPGIVSRHFAHCAKQISIAFESANNYLKGANTVLLGNPIREEFSNITKEEARKSLNLPLNSFIVMIAGGSQGAVSLNKASLELIKYFENKKELFLVIQTGKKHYEDYIKKSGKLPENVMVKPYFDNMALALLSADLIISRAGSLSISEICASSLPSILVPFPYSANSHQELNAKDMELKGASIYLDDDNIQELTTIIPNLINDKQKLSSMAQSAKENAKFNAQKEIFNSMAEILK